MNLWGSEYRTSTLDFEWSKTVRGYVINAKTLFFPVKFGIFTQLFWNVKKNSIFGCNFRVEEKTLFFQKNGVSQKTLFFIDPPAVTKSNYKTNSFINS